MKALTFKRGIHPKDNKEFTADIPKKLILPKAGSEIIISMVQHLGAPCEPCVEVGQAVFMGQKVGEAKSFVCSPVHASVSGVVKEIRQILTPSGIKATGVVIENDGQDKLHESLKHDDYTKLSNEEILTLIKEGGVVGLGGAGFPTHIKLNPPPDKKIDTIIVNGAECEPYLTTDYRVLLEETDDFIRGIQVILQLHKNAKALIGIETNKMAAIKKLEEAVKGFDRIQVVPLKPKYPQGAEKQLIFACTGREVLSGGLPADIGCIVDNVDTVVAIQRAVCKGLPIMRKVVTVSGDAIKNVGNYEVRIGMSYHELVDSIGGFKSEPYKMLSGGPMMGVAMYTLDVPIIKTSGGFLCFSKETGELPREENCIRCGKCVNICPMGLMPLELNQDVLFGETDKFIKNNGLDCIECGSCSYECPAKRYLAQSIRAAKREILAKRKK